jgi:trehalose 6-phosphate synthase
VGRADLLVASNRGPLSFTVDGEGRTLEKRSAGGLAAALEPLLAGAGASWVACAMSDADRRAAREGLMRLDDVELLTVEPDPATYRMAYDVVSNSTLWFCHHHLFDLSRRPRLDRHWHEAWDGYRDLNEHFAQTVSDSAAEGATVLVQDYHLCLLPGMLARMRPDLRCVHFTHTPFADPGVFRVLPASAARELLEGMSSARACGFHTTRWESAFLACCAENGVSTPRTFVSPLSADPENLARRVGAAGCAKAKERLVEMVGGRKVVLSVDRVELSKNLLRGLWAFDEMLRLHPDLRSEVVMLSLAYPSRQELPEYLAYATEIEHTARRINETWGDAKWAPVLLEMTDDAERSLAALTIYDVLLVNPTRDGLNLVAKEGPLVNEVDGVLALSREAGSFAELHGDALELNPFDVSGTAATLAYALGMSSNEREKRAEALRSVIKSRKPADWLSEQLAQART